MCHGVRLERRCIKKFDRSHETAVRLHRFSVEIESRVNSLGESSFQTPQHQQAYSMTLSLSFCLCSLTEGMFRLEWLFAHGVVLVDYYGNCLWIGLMNTCALSLLPSHRILDANKNCDAFPFDTTRQQTHDKRTSETRNDTRWNPKIVVETRRLFPERDWMVVVLTKWCQLLSPNKPIANARNKLT